MKEETMIYLRVLSICVVIGSSMFQFGNSASASNAEYWWCEFDCQLSYSICDLKCTIANGANNCQETCNDAWNFCLNATHQCNATPWEHFPWRFPWHHEKSIRERVNEQIDRRFEGRLWTLPLVFSLASWKAHARKKRREYWKSLGNTEIVPKKPSYLMNDKSCPVNKGTH